MRVLILALSLALAAMPGLVAAAQAPSNEELSKRADALERRVERLERVEKAETKAEKKAEARKKEKAKEKEKEKEKTK